MLLVEGQDIRYVKSAREAENVIIVITVGWNVYGMMVVANGGIVRQIVG